MSRRIAILGAGRLGESMLRGFLSSGWRSADDLAVTGRREDHLAELREKFGISAGRSNTDAIRGAGLVIISVKPQDMEAVLEEISSELQIDQTILSVAAGVRTSSIEAHLPAGSRVVRAMPNAPALVHEGIAGICGGHAAQEEDVALAADALGHLGAVVRVDEYDMDAVTALSGSGPAYFALLAEAMIEAGRASRERHLAGRHDDTRHPRARALRCSRRVPERDQRSDRAVARALGTRVGLEEPGSFLERGSRVSRRPQAAYLSIPVCPSE
jgi:pyrroline-5-carboxylate reductase